MPANFRPRRFARPRRLAPRDPFRVCFTPVTLLGFRLQGLAPHRKCEPLSRPVLSVVRPTVSRLQLSSPARDARLQSLGLPVRPYRGGRNPIAAVPLLTFAPLRLSAPQAGGRTCDRRAGPRGPRLRPGPPPSLRPATAGGPTHAPMRFRPCGPALRSVAHLESWRFLLAKAPALLGFLTSSRIGPLRIPSGCR
jgi:hypothetical protein